MRQGELIAAVAGVALFIFMFLPWFGSPDASAALEGSPGLGGSPEVVTESFNVWQAEPTLDLYLLIVVLTAVLPALMAASGSPPNLPISPSAAAALLGAVGAFLVFTQLLDPPAELDRKIGLVLGLLALIGVTAGGYMALQDEGRGVTGTTERF